MSQATGAPLHVFVYGTLRRGGSNDINLLQPPPQWRGRAAIAGTMYDFGRYPGVVLGGADLVQGEVYTVTPALLAVLDEIEEIYPQQRDEYFRREIPVEVAGATLGCVVYEINPRYVAGRERIASGDWIAAVHDRKLRSAS